MRVGGNLPADMPSTPSSPSLREHAPTDPSSAWRRQRGAPWVQEQEECQSPASWIPIARSMTSNCRTRMFERIVTTRIEEALCLTP